MCGNCFHHVTASVIFLNTKGEGGRSLWNQHARFLCLTHQLGSFSRTPPHNCSNSIVFFTHIFPTGKLCVEIEIWTPSASTLTSCGSLRSPFVRDVNPKLNEGNTHILQFKCTNIDEMRAKRAVKCAMSGNLKCRNDKFCAKNKIKPSNIEKNLVNARESRENLSFDA